MIALPNSNEPLLMAHTVRNVESAENKMMTAEDYDKYNVRIAEEDRPVSEVVIDGKTVLKIETENLF
jgi:hypothetical protein